MTKTSLLFTWFFVVAISCLIVCTNGLDIYGNDMFALRPQNQHIVRSLGAAFPPRVRPVRALSAGEISPGDHTNAVTTPGSVPNHRQLMLDAFSRHRALLDNEERVGIPTERQRRLMLDAFSRSRELMLDAFSRHRRQLRGEQ